MNSTHQIFGDNKTNLKVSLNIFESIARISALI